MQRCPERLWPPCASRGLGLQGPPTTHHPPRAALTPAGARDLGGQAPPQGRLAPPPPPGPAPGRSALRAAGGGQLSGEVGSQLRPRVARALSRRSWPGPGCSHGKARGRGAGPGRAGPAAPGGSAGTRGAAAPAVRGGRRCLRLRAQAGTAGGCLCVAASKFLPLIRAATERAASPGMLPVFLDRGVGRC